MNGTLWKWWLDTAQNIQIADFEQIFSVTNICTVPFIFTGSLILEPLHVIGTVYIFVTE